MLTHSIAGLKVGMDYHHPKMINQSAAYVIEPGQTDFEIAFSYEALKAFQEQNPHLSLNECEYIQSSLIFYRKLVDYNGMMLHSSAVINDGYAYLFSAPSGTGKSTHTGLWLKNFPSARILNDDKPAIRAEEDGIFVYGTPWSGKTDLNLNLRVPLGGICFLERSADNFIEKMPSDKAIACMLDQTVRPRMLKNIDKLLNVLDSVISKTTIYRMGCNISDEAAVMAYNAMKVK